MPPSGDAFDPVKWCQETGYVSRSLGPTLVVGPADAIEIIESRKRLAETGFQFGEPLPADIFLFSVGEASSRSQTKIGGLPYWKKQDAWPRDKEGEPLPFVGQLDFQDSTDIVQTRAKGDLLLVFGAMPSNQPKPEVKLIWQDVAENAVLVGAKDLPVRSAFDAFHGTRWRTANYPSALSNPANKPMLMGNTKVDGAVMACTLFATQISQAPFVLSYYQPSVDDEILCCFAPVLPVTDGRYPFLNHPEPLLEISGFDYNYDSRYRYVEQWANWGDSTSLFISANLSGELSHRFILG